jgi:hypothetical protein
MSVKGKLLSEKDIEDIALKLHAKKIKISQEKEKYINQLPYSDEYANIFHSKIGSCTTNLLRSFWYSLFLAVASTSISSAIFNSKFSINKIFR